MFLKIGESVNFCHLFVTKFNNWTFKLLFVFCKGVKTADPGDTLSTRAESVPTFSQITAEKRNHPPTPNNNNDNRRSNMQEATSIKVKLDKRSGIDEKIQEECRQVWIGTCLSNLCFLFDFYFEQFACIGGGGTQVAILEACISSTCHKATEIMLSKQICPHSVSLLST